MSYIILTYGLSITWILIAFMKYKQSENSASNPVKISIHSSLVVRPLLFTSIAWGLNVFLSEQAGFWLVGGGHFIIALYCISHIYLSSKKQSSLMSEHI
ncbi:MAG: hypothetical protein KAH03_08000 [Cocleimonas sp.]|nr:hypothetical protein [Cocleimonas sp.]